MWWWWTWQEAAMSRSVHHGIFSHLSFCCSLCCYSLDFLFFFFLFFFVFSVHIFPLEMYKNIKNEKLKVLQSVSIQLLCGVTPNCIQFFWMSLRWLTHIAITRLNSKKTFFFFFFFTVRCRIVGTHTHTHLGEAVNLNVDPSQIKTGKARDSCVNVFGWPRSKPRLPSENMLKITVHQRDRA